MANSLIIDAETLKNLYWNDRLNLKEIGKRYNVSAKPIKALMIKYGIKVRAKGGWELHIERDKLEELYNSGLPTTKIAKIYNCCPASVINAMKRFNIQRRNSWDYPNPNRIEIDKDKLRELYVDKKLSCPLVALKLDCSVNLIERRLKEYGWLRSLKQAQEVALITGRKKRSSPILGKIVNARTGYISIMQPQHHKASKVGYVFEHVLVWEEYHHKKLPEGYVIHHLNGVKGDNRPSNLVAMPRGIHTSVHHDEPYKKRIRQLEIENRQLRRALEDGQMIFTFNEN